MADSSRDTFGLDPTMAVTTRGDAGEQIGEHLAARHGLGIDSHDLLGSRGALIGRYVVLFEIGSGGMGVVFAAYDPELDRKVALKLLKLRGGDPRDARTRFQREAQALAKLDHANVVRVYDVGVHSERVSKHTGRAETGPVAGSEQFYVAMEFVAGQTFGDWMHSVEEPRPWREVLARFAEAGCGLAAAHDAGLVHRDFKPDNVMLGDDGRVRVMDFGLARTEFEAGQDDPPERRLAANVKELGSSALYVRLTQTGACMGTPAYMSPEQFEGRRVDPRSDQFSFCVALYEALYGEAPFAGERLPELMMAVMSGRIAEAPQGVAVPAWLRAVVLRGLRISPAERWPSMKVLLAALADDPAQRRRKRGAVAGLLLLLGAGAWGMVALAQSDAETCQGMDGKLAGIWDEDRQIEVEHAILATGLSYAPGTWERVDGYLDEYTSAWTSAREEACEATHRGEQSGELLDLRMGCLDERLLHVRATVDALAQADETVVNKAVLSVLELPRMERCADVDALLAEVRPPEDPVVARHVTELDEQLVMAHAKQQSGKYAEALAAVVRVVSEAQALGYEPLLARAWLEEGIMQGKFGDHEIAVVRLQQAVDAAVAQGMTAQAAKASAELVYVVGYSLDRHQEGRWWARYADSLSRAAGTDNARATYLGSLGVVAASEGEFEEARGYFERTLEIGELMAGPDHSVAAQSLNNLGTLAGLENDHAGARDYYLRALEIWEAALGPDHPDLVVPLNNLSSVVNMTGDHAGAREFALRALVIQKRMLGADSPELASSYNSLGAIADELGDDAEAREHYLQALEIWEVAKGREHAYVISALNSLGAIALRRGEFEQARGDYQRAATSAVKGADPEDVARAFTGLGFALLGLEEPAQAVPKFERALVLFRESQEDLETEESDDSASASASASTDVDSNSDSAEIAATHFALARALWGAPADNGRDRSRAQAQLAHAIYVRAGETSASERIEVEKWQYARGLSSAGTDASSRVESGSRAAAGR